jgi:phospholipase C
MMQGRRFDSGAALHRRRFLGGALAGAAALGLDACSPAARVRGARATGVRGAGTRPYPRLAVGTDTMPEIEHIVVLMLENHSFDNILGMLGRGDGFSLDAQGLPTATNPYGNQTLRAFHMPTPCQLVNEPSNSWDASHLSYAEGTCQGFADHGGGPVTMGYYDATDLPFTYGLARTFPINDRYFCSVMAQTFPNRRFLISGTALGIVEDSLPSTLPPRGVIFQELSKHGISWRDYHATLPTLAMYLPLAQEPAMQAHLFEMDRFFTDARNGTLPAFSLIDPNFDEDSEENPQDIQYGEVLLSQVVTALMASPSWKKLLFIWTYDEHGGYFDHVAPPAAVTPDGIPPEITVPPDQPGGYDRYGFRVPMGMVSPYAKPDYVSHVVSDHASILKLVETKWNLPALTRRDANASDLLDMIDLEAPPAFLDPPALPAAADPRLRAGCTVTGAGAIPPPSALSP